MAPFRSFKVCALQHILNGARQLSQSMPLSPSAVVTSTPSIKPPSCHLPEPQQLVSFLTSIGIDVGTATCLSDAYMRAALQLKATCYYTHVVDEDYFRMPNPRHVGRTTYDGFPCSPGCEHATPSLPDKKYMPKQLVESTANTTPVDHELQGSEYPSSGCPSNSDSSSSSVVGMSTLANFLENLHLGQSDPARGYARPSLHGDGKSFSCATVRDSDKPSIQALKVTPNPPLRTSAFMQCYARNFPLYSVCFPCTSQDRKFAHSPADSCIL
ncbi:hypothetical protein OF83DRAFT_1082058 [Amylostereum chailletii]|nr:hypothetical protein OF83DRAFT_1082058 [Amylostereum chailletii]